MITLDTLKAQRRWILWKLETVNGKQTKVPYQPNGAHAMTNKPETWRTYAECEAVQMKFSGIGLILGTVDGICVWGVDFDKCADAVTGEFTPETRAVVIELNSYGEYSPSGEGCHVLGIGGLPGKPLVRPFPGCKQIEIKSDGYYFTFSRRHLAKTPANLEDRQAEITALYNRVEKIGKNDASTGLTIAVTADEETRFKKLWAGDMSDYADDHSRADLALVGILAKRCNNNPFKIDEEFRKSGLMRDKWDRDDYRWPTINKVIKGEPIFKPVADEPFEEDTETEYLVDPLPEPMREGWFPKGELSLIGGASGAGKTSWAMPLLEKMRNGADIFGHTCKARDYRVLLHDRSKKAMRRTIKALRLPPEAVQRVIRLSAEQQAAGPAEILDAAIEQTPGIEVWFIEGLDLWIPKINDMAVVSPLIDSIQRVATRRDVAIVATMGSPKQKSSKERYYGRDCLFGSAALARKVETVVLIELHDQEDPGSARRCDVLPRNGKFERFFFEWKEEGLTLTTEPDAVTEETAISKIQANVLAAFQLGEPITYQEHLGPKTNFYRWQKWAVAKGVLTVTHGKYYLAPTGVKPAS